ncbi:MAG: transglutaminase domain-containing protein [Myxococcota bacterium]
MTHSSPDQTTMQKLSFAALLALAVAFAIGAGFEAVQAQRDTQYIRDVFIADVMDKTEARLAESGSAPTESERLESQLETMALATARLSGFDTTLHSGRGGPYRILKAPPADAARIGGQCGNLTRLFTTAARIAGLEARRAHLFEVKGLERPLPEAYTHAIVEVKVDGRWVIVDPLYGVVYRNASGQLAESVDLAARPELVRSQVSSRPRPTDYMHFPPADYNFELYHFAELRRIRWTILPGGEAIRSGLARFLGEEGVNEIAYPHSFERPHVFLAAAYGLSALGLAGLAFLLRRFWRGRA